MPKHLPRFSSGHTDSHCRMARLTVHHSRRQEPQASTLAPTSVDPRTSKLRASHQRVSPSHQQASTSHPQLPGPRRSACARQRASANPYGAPENRLDPRPSAPPPARAAMPKHLPRFSSGHTDSHWRIAAASRRTPLGDRSRKPRPSPPRASTRRTSKLRVSHHERRSSHQQASRVAPTRVALAPYCPDRGVPLVRASAPARIRMALRKTASIRAPQLRRRRGRLCQSTCHGFPPATRTRTGA